MADFRDIFLDFPWNDYCFSSRDGPLCAEHNITEVITAGMEAYIPSSFKTVTPHSWSGRSLSEAIRTREQVYGPWKHFLSSDSHPAFISARSRCESITGEVKHSSIRRKCVNLSYSPTDVAFWSLAENIFQKLLLSHLSCFSS